jgi:hypothetical protein
MPISMIYFDPFPYLALIIHRLVPENPEFNSVISEYINNSMPTASNDGMSRLRHNALAVQSEIIVVIVAAGCGCRAPRFDMRSSSSPISSSVIPACPFRKLSVMAFASNS